MVLFSPSPLHCKGLTHLQLNNHQHLKGEMEGSSQAVSLIAQVLGRFLGLQMSELKYLIVGGEVGLNLQFEHGKIQIVKIFNLNDHGLCPKSTN